jgi:zinc/manganese transport system permease protein
MGLGWYLTQPFALHSLLAATLVAISCGLIAPFVITRSMAFAVHGTSELAFTGAAAGLLLGGNPVAGALVGAFVVATLIGLFGVKERERDAAIGVVLAFGLGLGILLLSLYQGFATEATNILFGNIFGVSGGQLILLVVTGVCVIVAMGIIYRPLLFASVDTDVAAAKGVPVTALGVIFLYVLALTVTQAAQIVGTLLVLSLAITPAAAALKVTALSVLFALIAADGGIIASLIFSTVKPSVFVTFISFTIYLGARIFGPRVRQRRKQG